MTTQYNNCVFYAFITRFISGKVTFFRETTGIKIAINPYSGDVQGERLRSGGMSFTRIEILGTIFHLHANLWIGKPGRTMVGVFALLLLFSSLSGIYLWWPRGRTWRQASDDISDNGSVRLFIDQWSGEVLRVRDRKRAISATKTDTPIFDTPASIQVIPQAVIEDQQVVQLKDTLRNVTGAAHPGVYFQDQIDLRDDLHMLGGGRYDWARNTQEDRLKRRTTETEDKAFSPRVGLVYQPLSWLALYANFTESLGGANRGTSVTGEAFQAETATQYEAGLKTEFLGGRVSANLAF